MSKICIAGGKGLVGTALVKRFNNNKSDYSTTSEKGIDLRNYNAVKDYLDEEKPECVILVAAKHGGVGEYSLRPVEYFKDNLLICTSVISASFDAGVKKLINIGASCVYSSDPKGLYREEEYDKQAVQKSTEPYGLAKLSGMKLCEYYNHEYNTEYISLLPVNMYGDGDGYNIDYSSVLPAMVNRFHRAKVHGKDCVEIWGHGNNTREFLFADDFIDAIDIILEKKKVDHYFFNVGGGENYSINEIAQIVASVVGYTGNIRNDLTKPSGSSRGRIDSSRMLSLGWKPKTCLTDGIAMFYKNYLKKMEG